MVKFFRGLRSKYVADPNHLNGIYFATDTGELLMNGLPYGTSIFYEDGILKVNYVQDGVLKHGEGATALLDLLTVATESANGLMAKEDKEKLNILIEAMEAGTLGGILGIVEGEKILSLDPVTKLLSTNLTFNSELVDNKLQLLGTNNTVVAEFDVTPFIKDGMLDNVEVVEATTENQILGQSSGKFIEFTWNINDGESVKKDYIAVSDLAKTYIAGKGIEISATNEISVTEIDTDQVKVSETIPVAGGPLATYLNNAGITEIDANTDMQSLLFTLFCKEQWPTTVSFSEGTVSSTMPAPTVSVTLDGANQSGKTLEVGTEVTISKVLPD